MSKEELGRLGRILTALVLLIVVAILDHVTTALSTWMLLVAYFIPYFIVGWDTVYHAVRNLFHGQVLDENFLMFLATVGAFVTGEYTEAVAVMLFYQVGELFQDAAVDRSRRSIAELMDICPTFANVERDGKIEQVEPEEVKIGEIIVVKAGERIPLDGVILSGGSSVDTAALTGEAVPRDVGPGDTLISGCVNGSGLLRVQTTKAFEDSTVSKILELVENASEKKARTEAFITRFARVYTPVVVICALILAVFPPIFTGQWGVWIHRACTFLVVSCPCALVISVPLGFFSGIGSASRQGVLIKGGNYLEILSQVGVVVFDKTGTLTQGTFTVTDVCPVGMEREAFLELAALAESGSDHPIARSIQQAWGNPLDLSRVSQWKEQPGRGITTQIDGSEVLAGNQKLLEAAGIAVSTPEAGTAVYLAKDGIYCGYLLISDVIKDDAASVIESLHAAGVQKCVMLTGDHAAAAQKVASEVGVDEVHAELLPADKVRCMEEILQKAGNHCKVAFVGDGINDAPVLSRADLGIAMGAMGSDAAIEAADVVLMHDNLQKIPAVMGTARRTMRIVRQNIVFAIAVKVGVLLLTPFGLTNMWMAVFADVGVCVIAILNAIRAK
jgi:Cd2+/Zn2+-exporting ATPase